MARRFEPSLVWVVALAGAGAIFGLSAFAAFELAAWGGSRLSARARSHPAPEPPRELASSRDAGSVATVDARSAVRWAIAHAPVKTAAALAPYLDTLERQARERGKVTALDIEPGIAASLEHADADAAMRFSDRMLALQRELGGEKPDALPPAGAARQRADELFLDLRRSSGEKQQELIRQYLVALRALPDEEQAERAVELTEVAGRKRQASDTATLDSLRHGIDSATDEAERQDLIREYLALVRDLPEEEAARRLEELNARHARLATPASPLPR